MSYSIINPTVGHQQIAFIGLPDTTPRQQPRFVATAVDNYWGTAEVIYVRAGASIRQGGLCVLTPVVQSTGYRFDATEVPNTANLGRVACVAMTPMTVGQFGWVMRAGVTPVNCTANIAADTAFGIVAAGQGGVVAAGKSVLGGRVIAPATTTVAKAGSTANSGSTRLSISSDAGWFIGVYLSGTGIAAGTVVTDIDSSGTQVTLSAATTAAVNGTVTGTYNNATVFYNIVHIDNPIYQGPIT